MNRFRFTLATGALALTGIGGGAAALVHADGNPTIGKQVLDTLCAEGKGAPIFTPYAIGRCQEARTMDGFVVERLVCEGLLDGTFTSAPTIGRPNRTNWACIPGAISG
ncbi:MAG TPA: hypothetical protein VES40_10315 [Ilumatobacteraceae bacterium]|nr:hypothetical protein [Ilumatobacteraceae bacterium]